MLGHHDSYASAIRLIAGDGHAFEPSMNPGTAPIAVPAWRLCVGQGVVSHRSAAKPVLVDAERSERAHLPSSPSSRPPTPPEEEQQQKIGCPRERRMLVAVVPQRPERCVTPPSVRIGGAESIPGVWISHGRECIWNEGGAIGGNTVRIV